MVGGRARGWVKTERKGVTDGKSERSNGRAEETKEGGESDKEVLGRNYGDVVRRGRRSWRGERSWKENGGEQGKKE